MARTAHTTLLALAALPVVAGCGATADDPATVERAAAAPPARVVDLSASQFSPGTVRARIGEEITFVNRDAVAHTATATAGARFDSGVLEQGARFSFIPRKTGVVSLICVIHPGMTASIRVS